jgi:hypothetical protein
MDHTTSITTESMPRRLSLVWFFRSRSHHSSNPVCCVGKSVSMVEKIVCQTCLEKLQPANKCSLFVWLMAGAGLF